MLDMVDSQAIKLVFERKLRVAGETLVGEIHLNVIELKKNKIQEVNVKLRGSVFTYVYAILVRLKIPSLDALPIFTPIEFALHVVTVSKLMTLKDTPKGEPVFPAPPLTPHFTQFELKRNIHVRARQWEETYKSDQVAVLGGLAPVAPSRGFYDDVQVEGVEKVWLPAAGDETKQQGSWKQEATFRSTFMLTCPPSFTSATMAVAYWMRIEVKFPGIGNNLKGEFPVQVVSSMQPPGAGTWGGPPPELDLPPQSAGWHKNVDLVCDTLSVWKRGDPEKTPETHVINVPLSFSLRENLLPSGQYGSSHGKSGCTGNVDYYVEVVGARSGAKDIQIKSSFPVLSQSSRGAELSRALHSGWQGGWRTIKELKRIRRGIWEDYANVTVSISLPDIDVFPVQSPIPFILTVLTTSKPSQQEDSSKEQAVFPVPPADPRKGIELKLLRRVAVNAGVKKQFSAGDLTVYLGGLGPEAQDDTAQIDPVERTWVPTNENPKYAGFWRQEAKFRSTFTLDCAPSFEFRTIKAYVRNTPNAVVEHLLSLSSNIQQYTMHIKVNFPGVGNDVEFQFPADLVSNRPLPPQEVPP
ncbi:hypothetical protein PHLCEN_2v9556 [Hermanssonia centrifuga]|uniref:Arrestin-like N-terminal domain-containing protein n=1 Tax=Hermanssonia centrifuga TaxID=98765 RepID=A0A2R6NQM0_9APHY|nr:hypothetical protein PHLCEN_2v9556 [Hermanssonia centrifuga]